MNEKFAKDEELAQIIKKVSEKKDVLTDEAIKARQEYARFQEDWDSPQDRQNNQGVLEEFNENVEILKKLFQKVKFADFLYLLANPGRLFLTNLWAGFFWGLGFVLSIIVILLLFWFLVVNQVII
ncbi:hypothetical protein HOC37_02855 [bacterium]|jgi:hypothetical protein|nr:hypothetical protein [bacterium]MBT3581189.1 hypothetical protein [bacterium]MBT4551906.1 hypothetical protein [bacterium]MBT7087451.1 hypothetical protein [bacterium]